MSSVATESFAGGAAGASATVPSGVFFVIFAQFSPLVFISPRFNPSCVLFPFFLLSFSLVRMFLPAATNVRVQSHNDWFRKVMVQQPPYLACQASSYFNRL